MAERQSSDQSGEGTDRAQAAVDPTIVTIGVVLIIAVIVFLTIMGVL